MPWESKIGVIISTGKSAPVENSRPVVIVTIPIRFRLASGTSARRVTNAPGRREPCRFVNPRSKSEAPRHQRSNEFMDVRLAGQTQVATVRPRCEGRSDRFFAGWVRSSGARLGSCADSSAAERRIRNRLMGVQLAWPIRDATRVEGWRVYGVGVKAPTPPMICIGPSMWFEQEDPHTAARNGPE